MSEYDEYNNDIDYDHGDCYIQDGYTYYKKFGNDFRYKEENDSSIVDNSMIKNIHLREHFQSDYDSFIFTECIFEDIIHLQQGPISEVIVFNKAVTFKKCTFKGNIHFPKVIFNKEVVFKNCEFENNVNFSEALFRNKVSFEKSTFHSMVDFNDSKFKDMVSFKNSEFNNKVNFTNATFTIKADFSCITVARGGRNGFYFENKKEIKDTAEIIFDEAQFNAPISFKGRCFQEKVSFSNTLISHTFDFTDVDFGSKAQLSAIRITYHRIPNIEIWINILKDRIKDKYLLLANQLNDAGKQVFRRNSRYTDLRVTREDENILISRKDTSVMLGIPVNTLKTWTARGKSELVFKNEGDQCGYTLASIKEYNSSKNIQKSNQKSISEYSIFINDEQTITYKTPYVETKRKMMGLNLEYIPIVENKTIVGIFSNRIESAYTYNVKMKMDLQFKEVLIEEILNVVGNNIEGFLFAKPNTPVKKIIPMFLQDSQYSAGIGVIFLTHNGKADGKLMGMITANTLIRI